MVFIGVKMILHALHENGVHVIEVGIGTSLTVILGIMTITIVGSLLKSRADRNKEKAGPGARLDGS